METSEQRGGTRRSPWPQSRVALWSLAVLAGAVLVIAAVAGTLREPVELDPGTPEGVVQAYLEAVIAGDHDAAAAHLSADDAERCDASRFRGAYVSDSMTATLDDVQVRGERAEVRVQLREPSAPPPFGSPGMRSSESFELVAEAGTWRLTGQPWPVHWCPEAH